MLSWLGMQLIKRVMARNRAGDIRFAVALSTADVTFTFPGDNSWSGRLQGKAEMRRWLERFASVGLQEEPDEICVSGFPWDARMCVRGRSWLLGDAGERVYDNRFVIWSKLRWGRAYEIEVYEDTLPTRALDEWLERREQPVPVA